MTTTIAKRITTDQTADNSKRFIMTGTYEPWAGSWGTSWGSSWLAGPNPVPGGATSRFSGAVTDGTTKRVTGAVD